MNFQSIPPVESPDAMLDVAFKAAGRKAAEQQRKLRRGEAKQAKVEAARFQALGANIAKILLRLPKSFPDLEGLPEFYQQLIDSQLDRDAFRGALASVSTAAKNVQRVARDYAQRAARAESKAVLLRTKREGIGRISSFLKRLGKELSFLEEARTVLRTFPDVKEDAFVVAIAGFPNVGKSTLLGKLTDARPAINEYAFTTKTLNSGSFEHRFHTIQFLDTPGTLARPERMNDIERMAYLAMKYAAHAIIYVYDLTEPYPLADQERLEEIVKGYGKPVLLYLSKSDVLAKEVVDAFKKQCFTSPEELKAAVKKLFAEEFL